MRPGPNGLVGPIHMGLYVSFIIYYYLLYISWWKRVAFKSHSQEQHRVKIRTSSSFKGCSSNTSRAGKQINTLIFHYSPMGDVLFWRNELSKCVMEYQISSTQIFLSSCRFRTHFLPSKWDEFSVVRVKSYAEFLPAKCVVMSSASPFSTSYFPQFCKNISSDIQREETSRNAYT